METGIKVSIWSPQPLRPNDWPYSVNLDGRLVAIGYGTSFNECVRLARKGVRKAERILAKSTKDLQAVS